MDRDRNGVVSFQQMIATLSTVMRGNVRQKLQWFYRFADTNRLGYMTRDDFLYVTNGRDSSLGIRDSRNHFFLQLLLTFFLHRHPNRRSKGRAKLGLRFCTDETNFEQILFCLRRST